LGLRLGVLAVDAVGENVRIGVQVVRQHRVLRVVVFEGLFVDRGVVFASIVVVFVVPCDFRVYDVVEFVWSLNVVPFFALVFRQCDSLRCDVRI